MELASLGIALHCSHCHPCAEGCWLEMSCKMVLAEAAHSVLVHEQEYKLRSVTLQCSSLQDFMIFCPPTNALNAFVSHSAHFAGVTQQVLDRLDALQNTMTPIAKVCLDRLSATRCASSINQVDLAEVRSALRIIIQMKDEGQQPDMPDRHSFWYANAWS